MPSAPSKRHSMYERRFQELPMMGRTEKYQNLVPGRQAVTKVCIDDFAFRKRKTYETIMADIDTHMVIDLVA